MRIAVVQPSIRPAEPEDNVARACQQVRAALAPERPDLVLLPEAFAAYVSGAAPLVGEDLDGATASAMHRLAADGSCQVLFGMLRSSPEGLHNSAVLVDGERVLGIYDKTHLFYDAAEPQLNEQALFVAGRQVGLFDTSAGRLGVMICHDGTYPELARVLVLEGAEVICWLMNDGDVVSWAVHYARWNLVPIAIANCVGPAVTLPSGMCHTVAGSSCVVDGDGRVLAQASTDRAETLTAELDLEVWRRKRAEGERMEAVFRVRRPDLYGPLTRPYRAARPLE